MEASQTEDNTKIYIGVTTFLFTLAFCLGWFFASPPPTHKQVTTGNTIALDLGLLDTNIIGTDLTGWTITFNFEAYYDKTLDSKLDFYQATKGNVKLEDYTLSGIIRQIQENQTP